MLDLLYCESLLRWIEIAAISLVNADVYYPLLIDIHQKMDPAVKWEQANFVYCPFHLYVSKKSHLL